MSKIYRFNLVDNTPDPSPNTAFSIDLTHNLLLSDEWTSQSAELVAGDGTVDSSSGQDLVCVFEGAVILNLQNATWNSNVGDSGNADCGGCVHGRPKIWTLSSKA